jgi:hypothetical protein
MGNILVWLGTPMGELVAHAIYGLGAAILFLTLRGFWTRTNQEEYRVAARYTASVAIAESLMVLLLYLMVDPSLSPSLIQLLIPPLVAALDVASVTFVYLACTLFITPARRRSVIQLFRRGLLVTLGIYAVTASTWAMDVNAHPDLVYDVHRVGPGASLPAGALRN